jgi:tRNA A-37 threonylcarbamoyl transferase component Bud32
MSALLGTLLSDRYRLEARIGSGGMSTVYRAQDTVLERPVAIKLMNREVAADSAQLERFKREARAVAQLSHPHIVTVIDYGEDENRPYIVLEYVGGETLKQRIRRCGRLPVAEAVAYAVEIARALGSAHAHHIVHRDVKPQNVLIDEEGTAKVTDFGIARTLDEEGLTAEGRVLGTTDYVSPEQALGHRVTGQSDLYSLGIVLWEMLVGETPFSGGNQVAVAMQHVRDPVPDVQTRRPEISASLAAVVDRATTKELDRRYRTVADFVSDLEDALAIETARAGGATGEATAVIRTLPGHARRRLPLRLRTGTALPVLALVLVLAGIGVGIFLLSNRTTRGPGTPEDTAPRATRAVPLRASAATDYDPFGDDREHPEKTKLAVDNDRNTEWDTESYSDRQLGKPGVGLFLDARPGTKARFLRVRTRTPGFAADVFVADAGPPKDLAGWTKVGTTPKALGRADIKVRAGRKHRFWLLWITKLPPGKGQVRVSEMALYR